METKTAPAGYGAGDETKDLSNDQASKTPPAKSLEMQRIEEWEALQKDGWRKRESTKHPGHWFFFHKDHKNKKAWTFWKQAEIRIKLGKDARRMAAKQNQQYTEQRRKLRNYSGYLVVFGLAASYFSCHVAMRDEMNIFNATGFVYGGYLVVVHSLMFPWPAQILNKDVCFVKYCLCCTFLESAIFLKGYAALSGLLITWVVVEMILAYISGSDCGICLTPTFDEIIHSTPWQYVIPICFGITVIMNLFNVRFAWTRATNLRLLWQMWELEDSLEKDGINPLDGSGAEDADLKKEAGLDDRISKIDKVRATYQKLQQHYH